MSDRIVVMDHGVVRQVGTPEEIYDAPADLFVADFIGTINLLEGNVLRQTDRHIEVAVPGVPAPLLATPVRPGPLTGAVTLAIRPEAIVIARPTRQPRDSTAWPRPWWTAPTWAITSGTGCGSARSPSPCRPRRRSPAPTSRLGLPTERTLAYGGGDRG